MPGMNPNIAQLAQKHGWAAVGVSDGCPPFVYSVGLLPTFKHPELIVFGLEGGTAHTILSQMVNRIRYKESFAGPAAVSNVLAGDRLLAIRAVHTTQIETYFAHSMLYCLLMGVEGELPAMQLFWPDKNGKFPFDAGCDLGVHALQPRLDVPKFRG
jgi:hypothetical protein